MQEELIKFEIFKHTATFQEQILINYIRIIKVINYIEIIKDINFIRIINKFYNIRFYIRIINL